MKSEVLQTIKKTEKDYQAMISEARAEREHRIASAKLEADNLIMKAKADIEEYKKKRLSDAREEVARKRNAIIRNGKERADTLRSKGKKNLDKAVAFLILRFKEKMHVTS